MIVSANPSIINISYFGNRHLSFIYIYHLSCKLRTKKVFYICGISFNLNSKNIRKLEFELMLFRWLFPRHSITLLANTKEQMDLFHNNSIQAIFCSSNAFVDENLFKPLFKNKDFDAVYDATLTRAKRHCLAKQINSLALITYHLTNPQADEYVNRVRRNYIDSYWANYQEGEYHYMNNNEINLVLNKSKVGLCLSAIEGANYASIQYLLAGLPVCTTYNIGGRDEFFHKDYVEWVEDDPSAVSQGVTNLIAKDLKPEYIRNRVLKKINQHRKNYIKLIQGIYESEGVRREFADEWPKIFTHKMLDWNTGDRHILKIIDNNLSNS